MTKTNNQDGDYDKAEDDRDGDISEFDFAVVGGGFVEELEIGVGEDGEDDGELREAKAAGAEGINNEPGMREPGDFREN